MKRISKIITAVGVVTALLAGCCLDSQDVYGYLAGALCIIGGFLGGAGYAIYMLAELRHTEVVIQMDKPDVVWIEIEDKKNSTLVTLASTGAIYRRNT